MILFAPGGFVQGAERTQRKAAEYSTLAGTSVEVPE